jgi:hypothetical protein
MLLQVKLSKRIPIRIERPVISKLIEKLEIAYPDIGILILGIKGKIRNKIAKTVKIFLNIIIILIETF